MYIEFFVDNWLWFLLAGTVLLMTLIGYIAEKTDFGRKEIEKKEKPKKEKKNKKEEIKEQVVEVEKQEVVEPEVQISLATPIEEQTTQEDNLTMEEVHEELMVPFGDVTFDNLNNNVDTLEVPNEVVSPVEELKMDDIQTPELPDLNSVVEDIDTDSDDVWKF